MRKLGIIEIADNDMNEVSGGQLPAGMYMQKYDEPPQTVVCG